MKEDKKLFLYIIKDWYIREIKGLKWAIKDCNTPELKQGFKEHLDYLLKFNKKDFNAILDNVLNNTELADTLSYAIREQFDTYHKN